MSSNRLPVLAVEIRKAHADVHDAAKTAAQRAIDAGHALIEAKELVAHGEWLPWLREHCALSDRTARLYMQIARSGHESATVAVLGLNAAAKALTLKYCYHRPLYDGEEHDQREWRLFAVFGVTTLGMHPEAVGDHIDWIGRKNFTTVDEWLSDGQRWAIGWLSHTDEERRAKWRSAQERLAMWQTFRSEHQAWTIGDIDAEFARILAAEPPWQPKPMPKRRKRRAA